VQLINSRFGTEKKKTKIRKTLDPGPGSYDLPSSVGHIPKYLMTSNAVAASKMKKQHSRLI
jgi:hypothetical protein